MFQQLKSTGKSPVLTENAGR